MSFTVSMKISSPHSSTTKTAQPLPHCLLNAMKRSGVTPSATTSPALFTTEIDAILSSSLPLCKGTRHYLRKAPVLTFPFALAFGPAFAGAASCSY